MGTYTRAVKAQKASSSLHRAPCTGRGEGVKGARLQGQNVKARIYNIILCNVYGAPGAHATRTPRLESGVSRLPPSSVEATLHASNDPRPHGACPHRSNKQHRSLTSMSTARRCPWGPCHRHGALPRAYRMRTCSLRPHSSGCLGHLALPPCRRVPRSPQSFARRRLYSVEVKGLPFGKIRSGRAVHSQRSALVNARSMNLIA